MKKLLAAFLAGTLVFGCATPFYAEAAADTDDEPQVVNFEDIEPAFEGSWVVIDDKLKLYLPDDLEEVDLSEEEGSEDVLYMADNEDGLTVLVYSEDMGEGAPESLEELLPELQEEFPDMELGIVNGIEVIDMGSDTDEDDPWYTALFIDGTTLYSVMAGPLTDDNKDICSTIMLSISWADEEAETEA